VPSISSDLCPDAGLVVTEGAFRLAAEGTGSDDCAIAPNAANPQNAYTHAVCFHIPVLLDNVLMIKTETAGGPSFGPAFANIHNDLLKTSSNSNIKKANVL
jgi:hypothetical protein